MNGSEQVSPPQYGSMTASIVATAASLRRWVRVIAVELAAIGTLALVGGHVAVFTVAGKVPAARGFLIGVATCFSTMALALLVQSFLLFRYGEHLEIAARQRRSAPLADAARYENGYWWLTAVIILALTLGVLFVAVGYETNVLEHQDVAATAPLRAFEAQSGDSVDVMPYALLALGGVVLVGFALRP